MNIKDLINTTINARKRIFLKEKHQLFESMKDEANKGNFCIEFRFSEQVNRKDIIALQDELEKEEFETTLSYGIRDKLTIKWYPEEDEE